MDLELPFQFLQSVHLMVFPQLGRSGGDQDFLVDFSVPESALFVELRVFFSSHVFHGGFLEFVSLAPLSGWPEAALGDVRHASSEFHFYLRGMGVLKQGLRFVLIKKIDLVYGVLFEKAFDYAPDDGDGRGDPYIIAGEEPRAIVIG